MWKVLLFEFKNARYCRIYFQNRSMIDLTVQFPLSAEQNESIPPIPS